VPSSPARVADRWLGDRVVARALSLSLLGGLSPETLEPLLATAIRVDIPAGSTIYRADDPPRVALVAEGLLRGYFTTDDGRQVTLRYDRPGDMLGMLLVTAGPMEHGVEAVMPSTILLLDARTYQALARLDPGLAWLTARELGAITAEMVDEMRVGCAPVRQRVARHVVALHEATDGDRGVFRVTHQQLAAAVGSAREVTSRALRELKADGLVATGRDRIRVLDPAGLAAHAAAPPRRRMGPRPVARRDPGHRRPDPGH
jgi:CRP/FNR family cyclic AMP-dependent transcriptional regulator